MASGASWRGLSELMPEFTLVAPDMPSHGRSVDWDGTSSFADTVLGASLAALEAEPMDVIGHSFGSMTAMRLAVLAPERVRSLVLIEPVFFAIAAADAPELLPAHDTAARPFMEALEVGDMHLAARAFNEMWGGVGQGWDALPERTRAAMARGVCVVPDTYDLLNDDSSGLLGTPGVGDVTCPTLVIQGGNSHPIMAKVTEGLTRRMPSAQHLVLEGTGHMAPISHPTMVSDALRAFYADAPLSAQAGVGAQ